MWNKYVTLIVVVTCMCFIVETNSEQYALTQKRNSAKYCGRILSDMLSLMCEGRYNTKSKKAYADLESDEDYGVVQQGYSDDSMNQFPFRSRPNAASLLTGTFRRYTRGVYDECCRKPCTTQELLSYCAV